MWRADASKRWRCLLMALPRKKHTLPFPCPYLPLELELELELDVDGKLVPTYAWQGSEEASKLVVVWHIHHHAFTIEPNQKYRYLPRQSKLGACVERCDDLALLCLVHHASGVSITNAAAETFI